MQTLTFLVERLHLRKIKGEEVGLKTSILDLSHTVRVSQRRRTQRTWRPPFSSLSRRPGCPALGLSRHASSSCQLIQGGISCREPLLCMDTNSHSPEVASHPPTVDRGACWGPGPRLRVLATVWLTARPLTGSADPSRGMELRSTHPEDGVITTLGPRSAG